MATILPAGSLPRLIARPAKLKPPTTLPTPGITTLPTSEETILPNAAPTITPTARSTTFPFIANSLNSDARLIACSPCVLGAFSCGGRLLFARALLLRSLSGGGRRDRLGRLLAGLFLARRTGLGRLVLA